jgi:D-serine deaminase-like pyridoxal phosphate-dependent protein
MRDKRQNTTARRIDPEFVADTPVPVVDLEIVERNIIGLQKRCAQAGVSNRPHIKTHKSIELAMLQIKHGASGICCQKLGEAEVMAVAGIEDILITYNIIGEAKHLRLAALNERIDLTVACDNSTVAEDLSRAVSQCSSDLKVLVECDTGRHRCGVTSPKAAAELAVLIQNLPRLNFVGLMIYPPNGPVDESAEFVRMARRECQARAISFEIISAGGTPNCSLIGQAGETEYRAGTYIFNDRMMVDCGAAELDECALMVHATVVSTPESGRLIIDAGSKTLTSDLGNFSDFGILIDHPGARIVKFAEEHGFVDVSKCPASPHVGEIVRVFPNHVCPVVNLFDNIVTTKNGSSMGTLKIDARGKVT